MSFIDGSLGDKERDASMFARKIRNDETKRPMCYFPTNAPASCLWLLVSVFPLSVCEEKG